MIARSLFRAAWFFLLLVAHAACSADTPESEIQVQAQKNGDVIVVEASYLVAASPRETWAVLVDFERMSEFISNVHASRIVSRNGNKLQVAQQGKAERGTQAFAFESLREIELVPYHTIKTRLLKGSVEKMEGTTTLVAEGRYTRVIYRGEAVPGFWIPPIIGPKFIAAEAQEQLEEFRAEIHRRKAAENKR